MSSETASYILVLASFVSVTTYTVADNVTALIGVIRQRRARH